MQLSRFTAREKRGPERLSYLAKSSQPNPRLSDLRTCPSPHQGPASTLRSRSSKDSCIHSMDIEFTEFFQCARFRTRFGVSGVKKTQLCPQGAAKVPGVGFDPQDEHICAPQALYFPFPGTDPGAGLPYFWTKPNSLFRTRDEPGSDSEDTGSQGRAEAGSAFLRHLTPSSDLLQDWSSCSRSPGLGIRQTATLAGSFYTPTTFLHHSSSDGRGASFLLQQNSSTAVAIVFRT